MRKSRISLFLLCTIHNPLVNYCTCDHCPISKRRYSTSSLFFTLYRQFRLRNGLVYEVCGILRCRRNFVLNISQPTDPPPPSPPLYVPRLDSYWDFRPSAKRSRAQSASRNSPGCKAVKLRNSCHNYFVEPVLHHFSVHRQCQEWDRSESTVANREGAQVCCCYCCFFFTFSLHFIKIWPVFSISTTMWTIRS